MAQMMVSKEEAMVAADDGQQLREIIAAQQLDKLPDFTIEKIDIALGALQRGDLAIAGAKLGELRQAIIEKAEEIGYGR